MKKPVSLFLPYNGNIHTSKTVESFLGSGLVEEVILLVNDENLPLVPGTSFLKIEMINSSETIKKVVDRVQTEYFVLLKQDTLIDLGQFALERFLNVARNTGAGLVYSNYYEIKDDVRTPHPVIDYQYGSLRDDFDFGFLFFFGTPAAKYAMKTECSYKFAGLYDLRLKVSQISLLIRVDEFLYSSTELDTRKSGEKLFDYVNPRNREVQIEMELAVTEHLKAIGSYLEPKFADVNFDKIPFEFEASVVIPVKNRVKTIADAIGSVLKQKTSFKFNLFIVDNYSTDGTTDLVAEYAKNDPRVVHVIPERKDLGIGGCWNEAVHHKNCGKFAVQLDSDDLYSGDDTLQKIVDQFYKEKSAAVIGSYKMTNFNLEELPPGIIDHKEWTPDNGRNNALRINGLGAPRAYYTPILRKNIIPNVSYGEDYAVVLAISRKYQIGRIYEPVYLCRRWEGNTDSQLTIEQVNKHNFYKDKIRTYEVLARKKKVD
ncbi:MAG: glycosyltransferase family 2 protein [Ignavibacteriaceae bacterium]